MKNNAIKNDAGLFIVGASSVVGRALYEEGRSWTSTVSGTYCANPIDDYDLMKLDLSCDEHEIFVPEEVRKADRKIMVFCSCMSSIDDGAKMKDLTYKVNVTNTIRLMNEMSIRGFEIVFISSDYVFDGKKGGYNESEPPNPINEYGCQKVFVEDFLLNNIKKSLIVRLSKVCADHLHPKNIFTDWYNAILAGRDIYCIQKQTFSPTYSRDIAKGIISLLEKKQDGIFHLVNKPWSRTALAKAFVNAGNKAEGIKVLEKKLDEFNFSEKRPLLTYLDNKKFTETTGEKFVSMETLISQFWQKY